MNERQAQAQSRWTEATGGGLKVVMSTLFLALAASVPGVVGAQADGRPDFTGVWGTYRAPGEARGGFGGPPEELPLRPEARAKVDAYTALVAPAGDTPGGMCLGTGMPGSMLGSGGYPMEIVQHDDLIVVIYEAHTEVRHIYIADELHAADADLFPDRNGYSVGRWQGQKLIVETTHLKEAVDQRRYPHSDQATIIEEYELSEDDDARILTATMTLIDPVFYTADVEAVKRWRFLPGVRLLPYECNEPAWEEHLEMLRNQQEEAR